MPPHGHQANVRSHRRGGRKRRLAVAPWILFTLVLALVAGGVTVGYRRLARQPCTGEVKATVAASPAMASLLDGLARTWQNGEPAVHGRCAAVEVEARDPAVMAQALGTDWDDKSGGPPPDAWVPDSGAWVRRASSASLAERMMPDLQPSLARTPMVIAMPKPMAEALGWPDTKLTWQDVVTRFAGGADGWKQVGKDWGPFKFGMTDPLKSTSGLLALMAILDADDDGEITPAEQATVVKLKQVRAVYTAGTDQILNELAKADAQGEDAALRYVSAFPALEQDVLTYNASGPKVPLVAVYPSNGSADADHPYLVLDAPWADKDRQDVARAFLAFLRGPQGRAQFLDAGYRDPNRAPGKGLTQTAGFSPKLTTVPRAVLLPESVSHAVDTWTALTRPTNVLLVLDVSGSMKDPVPGTGKTRLALAKEAAHSAVTIFADDTQAGLWAFSTQLDGGNDYKQLVPLGKLAEGDRRANMLAAVDALAPATDTGLYDTVAAAQQAVVAHYQAGATNLVVLMTDGKNDDPPGGLSLDQLKEKLAQNKADAAHRVPVVTVAFGEDADAATLQDISRATGAASYNAKNAFDINQVLQTAIFGRV
jgi:Ca-activated chloride channel family protein